MFTQRKRRKKAHSLWIALTSVILTSCGYHIDDGEADLSAKTISVPYFKGDKEGVLTDTVIRALANSSTFTYANRGGSLTLEGKVIADNFEHIGYQYDRHSISGERINRLVPNEGRREISVEITLSDSRSLKILHGPFIVTAYSDYDFVDSDSLQYASFINQRGERESSLFFSLGQLDSAYGAREAALLPIYRQLAVKIAEGLMNLPQTTLEK